MLFPQPEELIVDEPVEVVDRPCERCGAEVVYRYRVADYRGWQRVLKCRTCLLVAESEAIISPVFAGPEGQN